MFTVYCSLAGSAVSKKVFKNAFSHHELPNYASISTASPHQTCARFLGNVLTRVNIQEILISRKKALIL